ncbi:acyltransferase [Streptomyces sp. AP-93]|uniref:acyltransferase family protein n=1 Tax=Streptomyces sp. AP-93 TaxID=2929048 RepID=UPI001FAF889C|nr:acyltransferase [Streptomyces sp. AP-93]MCJ0874052.1 acyltransferase [Streptomyces sp. AP-93]
MAHAAARPTEGRIPPALTASGPALAETAGPRPAPRLYALDGLRLLAALAVLAFHWTAHAGVPEIWGGKVPSEFMPHIARYTSYGWLGVQLFFIISGFVICMSCWGRKPGDFFVSRVVRVFPAYWAAVLLTAGVLTLVPHLGRPGARTGLDVQTVLVNFTMFVSPLGSQYVDGVYWTLWMELQFYLLFAIVVTMGLTYRRVVAFCGIWAAAALLAPQTKIPLLESFAMPQESPYFIAGVALFLMHRFGPSLLLWGIVGFSWLVALSRIRRLKLTYEDATQHPLSWTVVATIVTLSYLVIIAVALGYFDRVRWKGLTVAGALTYPLYLIHQEAGWTLIHWLRTLGIGPGAALAVSLAVALLTAWLIHRLVERPLSGLMKRGLNKSLVTMRAASDARDHPL